MYSMYTYNDVTLLLKPIGCSSDDLGVSYHTYANFCIYFLFVVILNPLVEISFHVVFFPPVDQCPKIHIKWIQCFKTIKHKESKCSEYFLQNKFHK